MPKDLMQRGFRRPVGPGVRKLFDSIVESFRRLIAGLNPKGSDFGSQRMCPSCGLITPRRKASCLECGHALKKIPAV